MRGLRELTLRAEDVSIATWRRTPLFSFCGALTASEAPNASDTAQAQC